MMKRIGESDITRIVQLFQKQVTTPHHQKQVTAPAPRTTQQVTPHVLLTPPYARHPTPYALRPTPYARHPAPYTRHPAPYTRHPTRSSSRNRLRPLLLLLCSLSPEPPLLTDSILSWSTPCPVTSPVARSSPEITKSVPFQ
ncbi:hypothetical protein T484DRAFT_2737772 [Baffinella frigidus]|nr:hypothetical protein T484DRAFT_2737772 [Cryptophyta sp. CCMP2293]